VAVHQRERAARRFQQERAVMHLKVRALAAAGARGLL
jgi:hypothetical protein